MAMADDYGEAITHWLTELKGGNAQAAEMLWNVYFEALVSLARKSLGQRRSRDEEDVAVSVFQCLCNGSADGRFSQPMNRSDVWKLLTVITRQKATDYMRRLRSADRARCMANRLFWGQ